MLKCKKYNFKFCKKKSIKLKILMKIDIKKMQPSNLKVNLVINLNLKLFSLNRKNISNQH